MAWFPTASSAFQRVAVEIACNPFAGITDAGAVGPVDTTTYKTIANALIDTVGTRAVLVNYSAREDYMTGNGNYQQMYTWFTQQVDAGKAWAGVQLARPQEITNNSPETRQVWDIVANWYAETKKYNFVETSGYGSATGDWKNRWPTHYNDQMGDITKMVSIGNILIANPGTWPA